MSRMYPKSAQLSKFVKLGQRVWAVGNYTDDRQTSFPELFWALKRDRLSLESPHNVFNIPIGRICEKITNTHFAFI